jgi:AAA family ATP:ADP antiporter
MWDQILRFSLNKSATELFYFPLDFDLRRRAKAFIEAGIERFGDAVAGLLILAVGVILGTTPHSLPVLILGIVVVWLVGWWKLRAGYVRELGRSLRRMRLDPSQSAVNLRERGILREMVRMLESPYERLVLHAMEILEDEGASRLVYRRLPALLEHASPAVRAKALSLAAEEQTEAARSHVARLIHDRDPQVRLMALRAHLALGDGHAPAGLDEFLDSPDGAVRATALEAFTRYAAVSELPRVRRLIEERLSESGDRLAATRALGARSVCEIHDLLVPLLHDPDLAVRQAALRAVGTCGLRDQVPTLIKALASRDTEAAARDGLRAFGELVIGTLGDWLSDTRVPIEVRRVIPRAIGEIPTQEAIAALFRVRDRSDVVVSYRILKASNKIRDASATLVFPADRVLEDIEHDVRSFLIAEVHEACTPGRDEAESFLRLVLRERIEQSFERVFRRLALLYPTRAIFAAYRGTLVSDQRVRGSAAEYLETALAPEHRALALPLLPDASPERRRDLAKERGIVVDLTPEQSLGLLLESEDPWLRSCALYVAGRRRDRGLKARVEASLEAEDVRVRETAGWARLALESG